MDSKKCIKCGKIKTLLDFSFRKDTSKYRNCCKKCDNIRHKEYCINIDERRAKRKQKLQKYREEVESGSKQCRKCDEIKPIFEFYFREDTKKYRSECKTCTNIINNKISKNENSKNSRRAYYIRNKEKININQKIYRSKNRNKINAQKSEYRCNNKEKIIERDRQYRVNNKEKIIERNKKYYKKNKLKILSRACKYRNNRERTDIQYKLACRLRTRLGDAIRNNQKSGSAVRDLGCSIADLKQYLETKFQYGMTWENYGFGGWHIDHIRPLASFDLTDRKQFLEACHYTNLQPLWATDNFKKGSKISY
jgi:hypothetical protein